MSCILSSAGVSCSFRSLSSPDHQPPRPPHHPGKSVGFASTQDRCQTQLGPPLILVVSCKPHLQASTTCCQRKVICYLELPLLIQRADGSPEKPQVSEAQLGVRQGMSPASACGLIRGRFLLLGGVEGDVCPCPHVFWEPWGRGFQHPSSSDLQAPRHPGACTCLLERVRNSWGRDDGRMFHA